MGNNTTAKEEHRQRFYQSTLFKRFKTLFHNIQFSESAIRYPDEIRQLLATTNDLVLKCAKEHIELNENYQQLLEEANNKLQKLQKQLSAARRRELKKEYIHKERKERLGEELSLLLYSRIKNHTYRPYVWCNVQRGIEFNTRRNALEKSMTWEEFKSSRQPTMEYKASEIYS